MQLNEQLTGSAEPRCEAAMRLRGTHCGYQAGKIRGERRNAARRAAHPPPETAAHCQEKAEPPAPRAGPTPARPASASATGFGSWKRPEPQGQAATPANRAPRNNTPGRIRSRRPRSARHGPPPAGPERSASRRARGCKQWPVSLSRIESHTPRGGAPNDSWRSLLNSCRPSSPARLCPPLRSS
jgi:hypothetical protein